MATPIENRNFLSPVGFNFVIEKAPKVAFFSQKANLPAITMIATQQPTRLRNVPVPGDELYYQDFELDFLVDEDMGNYMEIHDWMRGLGFPEYWGEYNFDERGSDFEYNPQDVVNNKVLYSQRKNYERSDANLMILNSNYNVVKTVKFYECFPISLSTIRFDASQNDIEYISASASFKYSYYDIV